MNSGFLQIARRVLLVLGIFLIVGTLLFLTAMVSGLINLPEKIIAGESTVHSVARVAIIGCLLAAISTLE